MQRFALVGAGFIGAVHARNLAAHPGVEFVVVHDVDGARADDLARAHGTRGTTDLDDVFDPTRVDAVFIASSTPTHAEHLRNAVDAGLAVLCEKPVATDLDSARAVVEHVRAAGVPAMLDFNRRFDRDHAELARVVAAGEVGSVELLQLTSRGPSMPPLEYLRASGGQLRDQAVHFFDLARWISGQDPVSVSVTGSALADPRLAEFGDVDTSVATLTLPSGALVQVDCLRRTGYGYDERIEVVGSTGLVESRRMAAGNVVRRSGTRAVEDGLHAGWFERVEPTYAAALDAFVRALEAGTPPPVGLEDGLAAQAVAEAATRALTSGRTETVQY